MNSSLVNSFGHALNVRSRHLLLLVVTFLAGCSANPIYTTTGVVLSNYSEGEATPYVMQMSDPQMACALGWRLYTSDAADDLLCVVLGGRRSSQK